MPNKTCTTAAEENSHKYRRVAFNCQPMYCSCISERRTYKPGLGLSEDVLVDVDHQVAAWQVLHDEAHVVTGLEAAVEVDQEGMSRGVDHLQNSLLAHEAAG